MKTKLAFLLVVLGALALEPVAWSKGAGLKKEKDKEEAGSGGSAQPKATKPGGGGSAQPKVAKPSGGGSAQPKVAKPSGGSGGGHQPKAAKPSGGGGSASYRPHIGSTKPQASKPSHGGNRVPDAKQVSRPEAKPHRPTGSGAGLPSVVAGDRSKTRKQPSTPHVQRTQTDVATKPKPPEHIARAPEKKKDGDRDFLGMHPGKSKRPTTSPGSGGDKKPKPSTTLPGYARDGKPDRTSRKPDYVEKRPDYAREDRTKSYISDYRPGKPPRPPRSARPERWHSVEQNSVAQWSDWRQENNTYINNFRTSRSDSWSNIDRHYHESGWATRYGSDDYWGWHRNVYDYRRHRGAEIWHHRQPYWDDCFDYDWWSSCWWRPRPLITFGINISPWWWWRPFTWGSYGSFYGNRYGSERIYYDPGTTVIYEGDTYYMNGRPYGSAIDARRAAIRLAMPVIDDIPVPEPVAEGQPEAWLPLGVWALTQQEQGDATMFMQLSVDKDGIVAGAYKNVMTGDEQPIIGQLDGKTQRLAWHVGEATQTVYETGIAGFENDVVSVFVHFGEEQTQTWLLVRLPSPELPPGTVRLPDLKRE